MPEVKIETNKDLARLKAVMDAIVSAEKECRKLVARVEDVEAHLHLRNRLQEARVILGTVTMLRDAEFPSEG